MANEKDEQTLPADDTKSTEVDNNGASQDSELVPKKDYENQKSRAEKAESKLKELQKSNSSSSSNETQFTQTQASPSIDVDERILKANGMDDELLKQLKDVAKLRNISLIDAQKDDLFVAIKSRYEKEETSKKASVRSSRGSGSVEAKKTLQTPGLTKEEHKALLKG